MARLNAHMQAGGGWEQNRERDSDVDLLVQAYQDRKRRYGPARAALVREATDLLVSIAAPEAAKALLGRYKGKHKPEWVRDNWDDLRQECIAFTLSAASKYRINGQGRFTAYVTQGAPTREAFREIAGSYGSPVTLDRNSNMIKSALGRIREEYLAEHDHPPSEEELAELVRSHFMDSARERIRAAQPKLRGAALDREARANLVKTGLWRALDDIPALRLLDRGIMLDEPVDEQGTTRGSLLADPSTTSSENTLDLLYRIALGPNQWARSAFAARYGTLGEVEGSGSLDGSDASMRRKPSMSSLAEAVGAERAQLRQVVEHGISRISAPHVHWAYLGGTLDSGKSASSRRIGGIPARMFADR